MAVKSTSSYPWQAQKGQGRVLNRTVYYPGDQIIEQGASGNRAFFIEEGCVEVFIAEDKKNQLKVAELGPGSIFGEMALINNEPRSASVYAKEICQITIIERAEIEDKVDRINDKAMKALVHVLVERLNHSTRSQLTHYKNLSDFQNRLAILIDHVRLSIPPEKHDEFKDDVMPLLQDLQSVISRYQKK